jgi:TatD DNase family protein
MKIIDTHSHLNFKAYDSDRNDVIKRTQEQSVFCIDIGTKYETSKRAVELAKSNENIYATIGMHPIHIKTDLLKIKTDSNEGAFMPHGEDFDYGVYKELALSSKKIVAIGEIGLDYYYKPKSKIKFEEFKKVQKQVFIKQLDLAKEFDLPVIIHCRMAHKDVIEIIKAKKLRGVVHCFTGTIEEMKRYLDLGFYIGINGIIFKLDLDDVIGQCPLNKILTETDCPYLTPPAEGKEKRNEPIFVKHIIQKIAELKDLSFKKVANQTIKNAKQLFKI